MQGGFDAWMESLGPDGQQRVERMADLLLQMAKENALTLREN